jgi:hypothetical protein
MRAFLCAFVFSGEPIVKTPTSNPVAKHARAFNKARVYRDRKSDYTRREKHKGRKAESHG